MTEVQTRPAPEVSGLTSLKGTPANNAPTDGRVFRGRSYSEIYAREELAKLSWWDLLPSFGFPWSKRR